MFVDVHVLTPSRRTPLLSAQRSTFGGTRYVRTHRLGSRRARRSLPRRRSLELARGRCASSDHPHKGRDEWYCGRFHTAMDCPIRGVAPSQVAVKPLAGSVVGSCRRGLDALIHKHETFQPTVAQNHSVVYPLINFVTITSA